MAERLLLLVTDYASVPGWLRDAAETAGLKLAAIGTNEVAGDLATLRNHDTLRLILISPDVKQPLNIAQLIRLAAPSIPILFLVSRDGRDQLRRELTLASPLLRHWSLVDPSDSQLTDIVRKVALAMEQRMHARTTLDRINFQLASRLTPEARDYRRLVLSDRYLASILEHASDAILSITTIGDIVSWNRGAFSLLGYRADEVLGQPVGMLLVDDKAQQCIIKQGLRNELRLSEETVWRRADGSLVNVELTIAPIRDEDGKAIAFAIIARDISERKQMQERLLNEKERLAVTLHSIGDAVITTDLEGRVTLMNYAAERLTGWTQEEAQERPLDDVFQIFDEETGNQRINPIQIALRSKETIELASRTYLVARDGVKRAIADSAAPIPDRLGHVVGGVLVFRDVTAKQRMEDELLKAQKLESIATLAGGIAHDFNNILTAILGNIELAKISTQPGDPVAKILAEAEKAFWRAQDLTRQLVTFARGGAPILKTASIAEILADTAKFILRGSNIRAEFSLPADLWAVKFDPGQISQVIQNLVLNAVQSMPEGGVVSIEVHNEVIDVDRVGSLTPGNYVVFSVTDRGPGIPKPDLNRIFDPYFSTKTKGTGLGLAITYSIVKRHGGHILVDSVVGSGSTFRVYLPASNERVDLSEQSPSMVQRGQGRILLMDDEEAIRQIGRELLQRLGYQAEVASDGSEAVDRYQQALKEGKRFDAVILDLTVPGRSGGLDCLARLKAIDADVRAIVSSGYFVDPVMADHRNYGFRGVVAKPYTLANLSNTLKTVIQ